MFRSFVSPKISPLLKSVTVKENLNMKNIFVGNLSFGATEQAVRSLFEAYGTVDRVSIVTDRLVLSR